MILRLPLEKLTKVLQEEADIKRFEESEVEEKEIQDTVEESMDSEPVVKVHQEEVANGRDF